MTQQDCRESYNDIESEGIARAWRQIEVADHILLISDATQGEEDTPEQVLPEFADQLRSRRNLTLVRNKIDLLNSKALPATSDERPILQLSAKTGEGVEELLTYLRQLLGLAVGGESRFIARRRHLTALGQAQSSITQGLTLMASETQCELLAEDLRQAQKSLSEIVGEFTSEDLLGEIFKSFCIGK